MTITKKVVRQPELGDVVYRSDRMADVMGRFKEAALLPSFVKKAPQLNMTQLAELLGTSTGTLSNRIANGKLPTGTKVGARTLFSIEEVREHARSQGICSPNAAGRGLVMTISNFKGGVAKTSTTVTLAQYLALRGYNVLVIDLDPQASATTLFGVSPYVDVQYEQSASALFDAEIDPTTIPIGTYWPGIDLIPASQSLYQEEFSLAAAAKDWGGEIFHFLEQKMALAPNGQSLRDKYDIILFDTQPSLGFLTSCAIFAADHLLVTVPPSSLDFASSVVFWSLLRDVISAAEDSGSPGKVWQGIHILQTRVDEQDKSTQTIRQLLAMGCEDWVLPIGIPTTRVATNASSEFATVYDIEKYEGSAKTLKRAREAFDEAFSQVVQILEETWERMAKPELYEVVPSATALAYREQRAAANAEVTR